MVAVRRSAAVAADETGWRVAGYRRWLWVFVGDGVTVYLIASGRGYEQAASILGEGFCGVLERDGWAPYRRFQHAQLVGREPRPACRCPSAPTGANPAAMCRIGTVTPPA